MTTQHPALTRLNWASTLAVLALPAATYQSHPGVAAPTADFTIIAGDYSLRAPPTVPAGWRTVRFHNQGSDFHHAIFLKVRDSVAARSALAALAHWQEDQDHAIPETRSLGGVEGSYVTTPQGDRPGEDTYATVDLQAGLYLILCMIPTGGRLHVNRGMHTLLRVVGTEDNRPAPVAQVTLSAADYAYTLTPRKLAPGWQLVRVLNTGTVEHVAEVVRLKAGRQAADLLASSMSSADDPVASTIGGSTRLAPGVQAFIWLNLTPGTYVVQCPLRTTGHYSHLRQGMFIELRVRSR